MSGRYFAFHFHDLKMLIKTGIWAKLQKSIIETTICKVICNSLMEENKRFCCYNLPICCIWPVAGTPNNFSTSTSLSDLTIDSHYSTSRSTGSKPTSKQPVKSIANHSSPSRLPSLLPKRQGNATGPPSQTPLTRLPQASSSPMQRATHLPTSLLQKGPQSISNAQCKTPTAAGLMDNDEMKSFGVEGKWELCGLVVPKTYTSL